MTRWWSCAPSPTPISRSDYLLPLVLGRVRGYDSLQIGETMFVTGAAMFLAAPIAGQLTRVMDLRVMLAIGLAMFGGGLTGTILNWVPVHLKAVF